LQNRMRDQIVFMFERRIAREIARTMVRARSADMLELAENEHHERLEQILRSLWSVSVEKMKEHLIIDDKKSASFIERKATIEIVNTIDANAIAFRFLKIFGLQKVSQISRTTFFDVKRILLEAVEEGFSEKETASLMLKKSKALGASRAQTIARTEVHAASSYSAQEIAAASEIEMRKEWIASGGDRTRDTHAEANGQIVGMHEKFKVGGELLEFPGDPSGSAENVINCRCVVGYVF
jgi:uncharacterized protein with gpF-like domain